MTKGSTGRRDGLVYLGAALALAFFVLALYARLLFTNRVLADGDILLYVYPYRDFAAQALREGRLPLWNPYLFMGAPFLANPQAAVLYPLHWPLSWLPVTKQVYWSAALHTWLLGYGGFLLLRRLGSGPIGALAGALALAGSGFYGGMIGHLNQMNGAAWLPWVLLVLARAAQVRRLVWLAVRDGLFIALLVALMLLAGHTQTTYINMLGAGLWVLWLALEPALTRTGRWPRLNMAGVGWRPLLVYGAGSLLGVLLSAPQLLPTLELSAHGLRSGGLSFAEATSFSLQPLSLLWTLLPTYGLLSLEAIFDTPAWSEFVAYIGLLALGLAAIGAWQGRGRGRVLGLLLVAAGLLLALGRWNPLYAILYWLVPGFDLFRTPARWMMLYVTGAAILAGLGTEVVLHWLRTRLPRPTVPSAAGSALLVLLGVELLLAARALPHTHPTAPQAVYDLRTAPAHLATDPVRPLLGPAAAGRFLGMSTITYDPGDMADTQRVLHDQPPASLAQAALDDLIIAQKVQELLVPNLPLLWRIPAVDGYDGGVLPLQRYNLLASLLAPDAELTADGRLREQIRAMPPAALLALLDAQYVVTDKVRDLWFEDVYYDRQVGVKLRPQWGSVWVESPETFEATHIDLIAALDSSAPALTSLAQTTRTVLTLSVQGEPAGVPESLRVTAGGLPSAHLADSALDSSMAQRSGAVVAFRDLESATQEYRVRLPLSAPTDPTGINLSLADPRLPVTVQAVTLLDVRTGMFQALLPSDFGSFQLVHSGDVKIYENRGAPGRVWLSYAPLQVAGAQEAADQLRARVQELTDSPPEGTGGLDVTVVEGAVALDGARWLPSDYAEIISYAPERVEMRARAETGALLVLADAWYPGWQATVDGAPAVIHPTNVLFRGVELPPGDHTIVFSYAPTSWRQGLPAGLAAAAIWIAVACAVWAGIRRAARSAL